MPSVYDLKLPRRAVRWIAALWGLAEATLFFLVPDVYLSAVGLGNLRAALEGCLWALAGALTGGVAMYFWGAHDAAGAGRALDLIPAIGAGTIVRVRGELLARGF